MKHLKYFVICLLGTLLLPGCYKDLGNYDYDEIIGYSSVISQPRSNMLSRM